VLESTAAHGLLAMAETGQGVAIVPSILQTERWAVRTMRVTHRRQPLRISLALLWDRRRMGASSAEHCGEVLAEHIRKTFPHGAPLRRSNGSRKPD
jgi:DNA-binding transcriptional LysR family regulator